MTESEFMRQQQAAVERMREMNARSKVSNNNVRHKMPPIPPFVKMPDNNRQYPAHSKHDNSQTEEYTQNIPPVPPINSEPNEPTPTPTREKNTKFASKTGLNIPFLDNILSDGDSTLILGLLLILMSENTDKMLLFALVYILL